MKANLSDDGISFSIARGVEGRADAYGRGGMRTPAVTDAQHVMGNP